MVKILVTLDAANQFWSATLKSVQTFQLIKLFYCRTWHMLHIFLNTVIMQCPLNNLHTILKRLKNVLKWSWLVAMWPFLLWIQYQNLARGTWGNHTQVRIAGIPTDIHIGHPLIQLKCRSTDIMCCFLNRLHFVTQNGSINVMFLQVQTRNSDYIVHDRFKSQIYSIIHWKQKMTENKRQTQKDELSFWIFKCHIKIDFFLSTTITEKI